MNKLKIQEKLIELSVSLMSNRLSEESEDYPRSVPQYVLANIERHNNHLRYITGQISILVKKIGESE